MTPTPNSPPPQNLWAHITQVYRASLKPHDIVWNTYVARPLAAPLVAVLAKTPITPNQVSFFGGLVFLVALVPMLLIDSAWGLLWAAVGVELAYVFDCVDGQLARVTGKTSEAGAYLDFLIDEFKALALVLALSIRLWMRAPEQPQWLFLGLFGVALVAVATSLTTFVRRPEYAGHTIKPGVQGPVLIPKSLVGKLVWGVERVAKWLVHYPSWILYLAVLDVLISALDGTLWFLGLFLGVYALYAAKTGLGVFVKLAIRAR